MTTEVEVAEKIINDLEEQREALFSRAKLLTKQREQVAYAAQVKAAKARLKEIDVETLTTGTDIESVEAALLEARSRLNAAKVTEAKATDRERALQLREVITETATSRRRPVRATLSGWPLSRRRLCRQSIHWSFRG
jgi:septal ring factor EnvC (AmiA/AmiB activator)